MIKILDLLGPPIDVTFSFEPGNPQVEFLDQTQILELIFVHKQELVLQYSKSKDETCNCFIDVDIWITTEGKASHVRKTFYNED